MLVAALASPRCPETLPPSLPLPLPNPWLLYLAATSDQPQASPHATAEKQSSAIRLLLYPPNQAPNPADLVHLKSWTCSRITGHIPDLCHLDWPCLEKPSLVPLSSVIRLICQPFILSYLQTLLDTSSSPQISQPTSCSCASISYGCLIPDKVQARQSLSLTLCSPPLQAQIKRCTLYRLHLGFF